MSDSLDITDLDLTRELVRQSVQAKLGTRSPGEGLALGGDMIPFLIEQVSIPLIVSLSASTLYDALKGQVLGFLQKREAEKALKGMLGKTLKKEAPLSAECLKELENQLIPLGFSRDEILDLYQDLGRRLKEKHLAQSDGTKNEPGSGISP